MKANITSSGVLRIQAETELEGFALGKWAEDYFTSHECSSDCTVTLEVNCKTIQEDTE